MSEPPGIAPPGEPTDNAGCLARINPDEASLRQLGQRPDDSPVIMLNLLCFRPRGDAGIYNQYGKEAAPEVEKVGSFVGYFGSVFTDLDPDLGFDASWDAVVMPIYHRRGSYLALQNSSAYQLAIPYRSAGTSRRMLYVLRDGDSLFRQTTTIEQLDTSRKPLPATADAVYVIDILRYAGQEGRQQCHAWADAASPRLQAAGASVLLSVEPEVPVLSEQYWDHCVLTRFPSLAAMTTLYTSRQWRQGLQMRSAAIENSITVATRGIALPG